VFARDGAAQADPSTRIVSTTRYDVLIVGAGAAGLAAGRLLADAGRRVAILEARERVGGRIFTRQIPAQSAGPPIPVELGAEFIHGLPHPTWELLEESGLKVSEVAGLQLRFAGGQWTTGSGQPSDSYRVLERMANWMEMQSPGCDMSFAEYLERNPLDASTEESVSNYVEGFNAADRDRIGIAALVQQQRAEDAIEADRAFRVEAGYEALPNFLAEEFVRAGGNLILGKAVQGVAWKPGAATIKVRDGAGRSFQLYAQRAVITVPLGVLQAESIDFSPRPEVVFAEVRRLAMGAAGRVSLIFRERFWREPSPGSRRSAVERELDHMSFLFTPGELPATWWTPMPARTPMLTAWAGGPKARLLQRLMTPGGERNVLLHQCLATLAKVFDLRLPDLENLLLSWHTHDWQTDPYARGAYSYVPAGALEAPERMSRPVENTLYFAGEHTDTLGQWGTVHAALTSGMRAARQVLRAGE
jgi:monoamine oxidase